MTMTATELGAILQQQRDACLQSGAPSLALRRDRIDRCISLLVNHQVAICDAVNADFGCRSPAVTLMSDIFTSINNLKYVKQNVHRWIRPQKRQVMYPLGLLGGRARVHFQPKGVVGIMSPWNIPVNLIFGPLADVLGAGNRAMIKPSEHTPATSALIAGLVAENFDLSEIAVVTGGPEVAAEFSSMPFDHLIFTGSTAIGSRVMKAAARNLTPVTLELGGKSPVIISANANLEDAAEKIITFKAMNGGQICLSPDYCYVPRDKLDEFIRICQDVFIRQYPKMLDNPDYVSIISDHHFQRLLQILDDAQARGAQIVALAHAEEPWRDSPQRKMPVHLVINPDEDMEIMQEEVFGPLMSVRCYSRLQDCVQEIQARPQPLALYYFGKNQAEQDQVLADTLSGGVCMNDLGVHFASDDLPFGGIGASGMGHYHGFDGFKTFSHARAVYHQGRFNLQKISGTLPPYGKKIEKLMSRLIRK
jgi:coniferyl-aldehyde dehydrogenase